MIKKLILFSGLFLLLSSCANKKDLVYFQDIASVKSDFKYQTTIQPDDLLLIFVSSTELEAAAPFNLPVASVLGTTPSTMDVTNAQIRYQTYLVDNLGVIQFPVLGAVKVGGLTREEVILKFKTEIKKYIKDPIINLRIMNYKVSVMGEVLRPGVFSLATERITLPEAISMAGDLTIYGSRHQILVIRESNGQKTYNYVDVTKADFINSPFYYLTQNDLVYVVPNKTKINSSSVGPNTSIIISAVSLLLTTIALLTR